MVSAGRSGDWLDNSMLTSFADQANAIIVMPEVARSFYADMRFGLDYFSFVADEVPKICADVFNISADRERTSVIGGSMGAFGALRVALLRPERYARCAALASPALFLREDFDLAARGISVADLEEIWGERLIRDFQAILGVDLEVGPEMDVPGLARAFNAQAVRPRFYAACGTKDSFVYENRRFAKEMQSLGYDYVYEEWPASHDRSFFNDGSAQVIGFLPRPGGIAHLSTMVRPFARAATSRTDWRNREHASCNASRLAAAEIRLDLQISAARACSESAAVSGGAC